MLGKIKEVRCLPWWLSMKRSSYPVTSIMVSGQVFGVNVSISFNSEDISQEQRNARTRT